MVTITLLAEHDCLSSGICGTADAFFIAGTLWQLMGKGDGSQLFKTQVATLDGEAVRANAGILIQPDCAISDVDDTTLIIVPASYPPFDLTSERAEASYEWLRKQHESGVLIAATCTGAFLLAQSGLLCDKIATTNWQFAGYFRSLFPDINLRIDRIFTEDQGIYCSGAATAFMDLCLHFIEKFGSKDLALRCSKSLLIDPGRETQIPYIVYDFWKNHSDEMVLKSQAWIEENFTQKLTIEAIAQKTGISPRQFTRRFKKATGEPPMAYLQMMRIEDAKRHLETTEESVNEITWRVGYEDINSFRRLFKKHTGLSPKEYRNKFGCRPQERV